MSILLVHAEVVPLQQTSQGWCIFQTEIVSQGVMPPSFALDSACQWMARVGARLSHPLERLATAIRSTSAS